MTPRHSLARRSTRTALRGQAMVEYLVIALIALAIVAVPIAGNGSAVDLLLDSVRTAYVRFLASISIPS